ncbi:microsomal glutathione S-transferase 2-like [Saccostrea echinata]|uniref:microsomal glutathione S-transferase 2-like n=1 Tax=Saccostrea echinata TaxID=191078 RepID=UPI002A81BBDC|nr:microsomal glutathione S-transferase 2-like [Saccostrea echinata]
MPVELRDIVLLGGVSVAHAWQLSRFARRVGAARGKFKVNFPATTGNEDFERYYRAQMNTLEFFPIFSTTLWMGGLFFHQVPAAIAGVVYIYARQKYFNGYIISVKDRLPGFKLSVRSIIALLGMCVLGFSHLAIETFTGINIREQYLQQYLKF